MVLGRQEIMVQSSSRTLLLYTQGSTKKLQQLRSPFDDLELNPFCPDGIEGREKAVKQNEA
jgi:hypothetical protein